MAEPDPAKKAGKKKAGKKKSAAAGTTRKKKPAAKKSATKKPSKKKKAGGASGAASGGTSGGTPGGGAVKQSKKKVAKKKKVRAAPGKAVAEKGIAAGKGRRRPSDGRARTGQQAVPYASLPPAEASTYDPSAPEPSKDELRKVKSGLKKKDLKHFQLLLLERRAEIIGDVQGLEAARNARAGDLSHMPLHMADVGSDNYDQEFTLGLMQSERRILVQIDEALQRIEDGFYGVCEATAQPIQRARLEAQPWAKHCIEVARAREKRGL